MASRGAEWIHDTLRLAVYNKAYAWKGYIGVPTSLEADMVANQVGTLTFSLATDERPTSLWTALATPGARCVLDHADLPSRPAITGRRVGFEENSETGQTTFTVRDDLVVLFNLLGWPDPAHGLDAQAAPWYLDDGPAETVLKTYVSAMLPHYPDLELTVAPDLGRGDTIDLAAVGGVRFDPIADQLLPLCDRAGLRVTVVQQGTTRVLDVEECPTFPTVLDAKSGKVQKWTYAVDEDGVVTDAIGGDSGTEDSRAFYAQSDDLRAASLGERLVRFVDASSSGSPTDLLQQLAQTLFEGEPGVSSDVTLAETPTFRFGDQLPVGTRVNLQLGSHPIYQDLIRSVQISLTTGEGGGLLTTPQVGNRDDDPLVTALANALARVDRLERR